MKTTLLILLFMIFGLNFQYGTSYKILMMFSSISPSHLIVASGLLKGLTKYDHEVTMVSPFPQTKPTKPLKNYRDIVIPYNLNTDDWVTNLMKNAGSYWTSTKARLIFLKTLYELSNSTMSLPEFRKIMNEESFDLVILGVPYGNYYFAGLAHHFNCPLIALSHVQTTYLSTQLVGNPMNVASSGHLYLGNVDGVMSFRERIINFLIVGMEFLMIQYVRSLDRAYYESNFPPEKYPTYEEAIKKVSLLLVNNHVSQGAPRANVPAIVEIGGVHIEGDANPLPDDLQEFLDNAPNGVIFFSLGSNLKSSLLPEEQLNAIWKSFEMLQEKVLMKWETDQVPNIPSNVKIGKWLPQRDILAHKNLKVFVSHGAIGSITEARYWGVPIIGIPFFGDQMSNVAAAVKEGWAYQLNFDELTEESFSKALQEVLSNPKYRNTVEKMAQLYKDRPQTALETANYWIEYVIRHNGAPHLQSHAVHLNFWQNNSIDVIVFLIVTFYMIVKISVIIIKLCWKMLKKNFTSRKDKQL
ncbi:hypothetical protein DMENIID0001_111230 [Sergentomyia squamirostris]